MMQLHMCSGRYSHLSDRGANVFREARFARFTLAAGAANRFKPDPHDKRQKALFEITYSGIFKDGMYLSIQAKDIAKIIPKKVKF